MLANSDQLAWQLEMVFNESFSVMSDWVYISIVVLLTLATASMRILAQKRPHLRNRLLLVSILTVSFMGVLFSQSVREEFAISNNYLIAMLILVSLFHAAWQVGKISNVQQGP